MQYQSESIGDRIGRLRERRGLTQEQLAERASVSVDTVRKLEQNRRLTARLVTLNRLARTLDVETSVLVGQPTSFEAWSDGDAPSVLALRQAVSPLSDLLGEDPDPEDPPPVGALRASLRSTEVIRREGRMGEIGALLPQLIRDARAAARAHHGGDQAAAYAVLAEAYQVAATTLTALGREDAAFTAMERAVEAAGRSDDPHLESIGASTLAWIFTKQGRLEDAERVARRTPTGSTPDSAPGRLSCRFGGSCYSARPRRSCGRARARTTGWTSCCGCRRARRRASEPTGSTTPPRSAPPTPVWRR